MSFGTVCTIILVGYALYYLANIIYDLFYKKEASLEVEETEEEEIDISEMIKSEEFSPKQGNEKRVVTTQTMEEEMESELPPSVTSGFFAEDFRKMAEETMKNPDDSPFRERGIVFS